ncbi:hypothetical protein [Clavibacter michiganensis]|uniref:hypothetical protein n=1 Tax=Clavibacter michiganensis TaxID=28447 RepID=UPI00374E0990
MAAAGSDGHGDAEAFRKERPDAPRGFFEAEAAGLAWLAEAEPGGGARVVRGVDVCPLNTLDAAGDGEERELRGVCSVKRMT